MGVKNLWKIVKPLGKTTSLKNKKLAIDTSIWMYQLPTKNDQKLIYAISKRIFKILYNDIIPIFVFDGNTPAYKKKTIEMRKKQMLLKKINHYINDGKCIECHKLAKECEHMSNIDEKTIIKLDDEAINRIRNHSYDWGEFSDENNYLDDGETIMDAIKVPNHSLSSENVNPLINFDLKEFDKLNKIEKLQKLLYLREKRGMPMEYNTESAEDFSNMQIKNVKKRNMIYLLMKSLNEDNNKRVQNDWKVNVEYEKEKTYKLNSYDESQKRFRYNLSTNKESIINIGDENNLIKVEEKMLDKNNMLNSKLNDLCKKYEHIISKSNSENFKEDSCKVVSEIKKSKMSEFYGNNLIETNPVIEIGNIINSNDSRVLEDIFNKFEFQKNTKYKDQIDYINTYNNEYNYVKRTKNIIMEVLDAFNIKYIESIYEADSQCAYLNIKGVVDGVISEDNDILLYKANIYKNFFKRNRNIELYEYKDIEKFFGFKDTDIIKLSYLLGSDYANGVYGIGIKKAFDKLKDVTDDDISDLLKIYNFSHIIRIEDFKNGLINKDKLKKILYQYMVPIDQIDEIMFFAEKYNEKQHLLIKNYS